MSLVLTSQVASLMKRRETSPGGPRRACVRRQMGLNEAAAGGKVASDGGRCSAGQVTLKVSAEALQTDELCGNQAATVPQTGRMDTVVRTLLVEVSAGRPPRLRLTGTKANVAFPARRLKERHRWSATTPCSAPQVRPEQVAVGAA